MAYSCHSTPPQHVLVVHVCYKWYWIGGLELFQEQTANEDGRREVVLQMLQVDLSRHAEYMSKILKQIVLFASLFNKHRGFKYTRYLCKIHKLRLCR